MDIKPDVKPGAKTSEFWVAVLLLILPIVKQVFGIDINADDATNLVTNLVTAVGSVVAVVIYIRGRIQLKKKG